MRRNLIITLIIGLMGASIQCIQYNVEMNTREEVKRVYEKEIEGYKSQIEEGKNKNEELKRQLIEMEQQRKSEVEELNKEIDKKNKEIEELSLKKNEISVELTGYCNCAYCSGDWKGITASGERTRVGVIAVPKEIPLGTKLEIPYLSYYKSDAIFEGLDRGGAIITKADGTMVIDVWFPTHEQALEFGRVKTVAYIK